MVYDFEVNSPNVPFDEDAEFCCESPSYEYESMRAKLHQSRGYVDWECANCGTEKRVEYSLNKKVRVSDGKTFHKDATDFGPCEKENHSFVGNQTTVLDGSEAEFYEFFVLSECEHCDLTTKDVLTQM